MLHFGILIHYDGRVLEICVICLTFCIWGGLMMGSDGENVYRRAVEKRPMTIVRDREKYVKTQRRNTMYKRCKEEDK